MNALANSQLGELEKFLHAGWHLEQAYRHRRELGPLDARGRAIGERAARRLAAAGRRALGRDDVPLAASLLGRALDGLDPRDPARADLALDWCEALLSAGEVGAAAGPIATSSAASSAARSACGPGTPASPASSWRSPTRSPCAPPPTRSRPQPRRWSRRATPQAKPRPTRCTRWPSRASARSAPARPPSTERSPRRTRDRRRSNAVLAGAPLAALWGPGPVARASGRCLDVVRVLRITEGAPAVEAVALRCQAVLEALRGRNEAARRMIASSRRMVEELGITQGLLETEIVQLFDVGRSEVELVGEVAQVPAGEEVQGTSIDPTEDLSAEAEDPVSFAFLTGGVCTEDLGTACSSSAQCGAAQFCHTGTSTCHREGGTCRLGADDCAPAETCVDSYAVVAAPTPVPEPQAWLQLLACLGALALLGLRRARA
jgi:hypothetical protein